MRKPQKRNLALFGKKLFSVFGLFQAVFWRNRLDIARCKTTGSGRLYGVERIVLVCNA